MLGQNLTIQLFVAKGYLDVASMHRNTKKAREKNEKLLLKILKDNKNTEFGIKHHFKDINSINSFRKNVPLTTYADYEDSINKMIYENKTNLITSKKVIGYAKSSGTIRKPKYLPITQDQVMVYTKYTVTRMMALADKYMRENYGKHVKPGKGICTFPAFNEYLPNGLLGSNVADVAAKQLSFFYKFIIEMPLNEHYGSEQCDYEYINHRFALEDKNCMYVFGIFFKNITDLVLYLKNNWQDLVNDIEHGTIKEDVFCQPEIRKQILEHTKPNPKRAEELRAEFEKGFDNTIIQRIWPNLSVMSAIGTASFEPFMRTARQYTSDIPYDFSIMGASEGLFAAADKLNNEGQLLLVDSCYYEFLSVDENDSRIYSIDELEVGNKYEIIITTKAGLYRYRIGDIVEVVGYMNDCPYIVFSNRKGQLINIIGEKSTEEHMQAVVNDLQEKANVNITSWTVGVNRDVYPNYYELLIENEDEKDLSSYADYVDKYLGDINERYFDFRKISVIGKLQILNLKKGTQEAWFKKQVDNGASYYQTKPVRILDNVTVHTL